MNNTIETILTRRSVRFFDSRPIDDDILQKIIECGNAAPSGNNVQQWRFVVATSENFRKKMKAAVKGPLQEWIKNVPENLRKKIEETSKMTDDPVYYNAPVVIFVIGSGMTADMDSPMVCENMMLAARSLGVGSCWIYSGQLVLSIPEYREILELKEEEKVYGPIVFGYPAKGFPESPVKKKPVVKML